MEININEKSSEILDYNTLNITIEHSTNVDIDNLIEHIKKYDNKKVLVKQNNEYLQIDFQDIIIFYSDKKFNYCRTKQGEYKINYSLNRLESERTDFIRISKSCIINIKHLDSFDMGKTGIIIAKLDDGTEEIVSRRRVKLILKYIKERSL